MREHTVKIPPARRRHCLLVPIASLGKASGVRRARSTGRCGHCLLSWRIRHLVECRMRAFGRDAEIEILVRKHDRQQAVGTDPVALRQLRYRLASGSVYTDR